MTAPKNAQEVPEPAVPDDVDGLQYFPVEGGVRLTWRWPDNCTQALVLAGRGQDPAVVMARDVRGAIIWRGAEGMVVHQVSRYWYQQDGDSFYLELDTAAAPWHVKVCAVAGERLSAGCTCQIPQRRLVRLEYQVNRHGARLVVKLRPDPPGCKGFGFVVRGDPQDVPQDANTGTRVFPLEPNPAWPSLDGSGWYTFEGIIIPEGLRSAQKLYFRLFLDPDSDWMAVRHPADILDGLVGTPVPKRRETREVIGDKGPRSLLCPYCLDRFGWWQVRLWENGRERRHRAIRRLLAGMLPWLRADVNEFKSQEGKLVCPKSCRKKRKVTGELVDLDSALFVQPMVLLALYGATQTGKSHWILGAYQRMQFLGLAVTDGFTRTELDKMVEQVTEHRQRLLPTQVALGEVVRPYVFDAHAGARKLVLALHDIDGDACVQFGRARGRRYWRACKGIIFMLDPLHMTAVRRHLEDHGGLPDDAPPESAVRDQANARQEFLGVMKACPGLTSATPVAVVVSRGDIACRVDPRLGEALWDDPLYQSQRGTPKYDMALHWRVQFAVRRFLEKYERGVLQFFVPERFKNLAYFCVAPTGSSAERRGDVTVFPRVAPWRVEEPAMWILSQLGLIEVI
ncbi:MAG: hypothetical protein AAB403_18675 [Planctomycetota bacterium]